MLSTIQRLPCRIRFQYKIFLFLRIPMKYSYSLKPMDDPNIVELNILSITHENARNP